MYLFLSKHAIGERSVCLYPQYKDNKRNREKEKERERWGEKGTGARVREIERRQRGDERPFYIIRFQRNAVQRIIFTSHRRRCCFVSSICSSFSLSLSSTSSNLYRSKATTATELTSNSPLHLQHTHLRQAQSIKHLRKRASTHTPLQIMKHPCIRIWSLTIHNVDTCLLPSTNTKIGIRYMRCTSRIGLCVCIYLRFSCDHLSTNSKMHRVRFYILQRYIAVCSLFYYIVIRSVCFFIFLLCDSYFIT